ncbi:MAG: hypothetical protein ACLVKO_06925 [Dysgonomonas sp.]
MNSNAESYWDMANNKFRMGGKNGSIDWNENNNKSLIMTNAVIDNSLRVNGEAQVSGWKIRLKLSPLI